MAVDLSNVQLEGVENDLFAVLLARGGVEPAKQGAARARPHVRQHAGSASRAALVVFVEIHVLTVQDHGLIAILLLGMSNQRLPCAAASC